MKAELRRALKWIDHAEFERVSQTFNTVGLVLSGSTEGGTLWAILSTDVGLN